MIKRMTHIIYIIVFLIVVLLINITLIFWKNTVSNQIIISNNLISRNAIELTLEKNENISYAKLSKVGAKCKKILIFNVLGETDEETIIAYFGNSKIDEKYLLKGRFFEKSDFLENKQIAIVGKNILSGQKINFQNDTHYYIYNNEEYKIVGIVGYTHKSNLDNLVLLNLDSVIGKLGNIYYLDGDNRTLPYNYSIFKDIFNVDKVLEREFDSVSRIGSFTYEEQQVTIFSYTIVILFVEILSLLILKQSKKEILIEKLLGFSLKYIILKISLYLIKAFIICWCIFTLGIILLHVLSLQIYLEILVSFFIAFLILFCSVIAGVFIFYNKFGD